MSVLGLRLELLRLKRASVLRIRQIDHSLRRQSKKRPRDATDGYTLLELLVSLALMAVIAGMIGGVIVQLRPLKSIEAQYEQQRQLDAIAEIMARDLEGALRLPLLDSTDQQIQLIGTPTSVRFVAVVKTGFRAEGLREVTYRLDETNHLIRETRRRQFGRQAITETSETFALPQSIALRYFVLDTDSKPSWRDNYDMLRSLPRAVQIVLTGLRNGKSLSSVVSPRLTEGNGG